MEEFDSIPPASEELLSIAATNRTWSRCLKKEHVLLLGSGVESKPDAVSSRLLASMTNRNAAVLAVNRASYLGVFC